MFMPDLICPACGHGFDQPGNATKSAFLSIISHEIRTPLNAVLGMAQALAGGPLAPTQREQVDLILGAGLALLALVDDLLDFSGIEAGRFELDNGVVDLAEVVTAVQAMFDLPARDKGIRLSLDIRAGARGFWRCDAKRVRQVMSNLVANAVKFTDWGEVRIVLDRNPEAVVLSVADTGPGIAPGLRDRLFEPFVQGDFSRTRRHGGVGLGLAICRELVRGMGGDISLATAPGHGATFTVQLPLEAAEALPDLNEARQPEGVDTGLRILVAEDNPTNRLVIETFFQEVGVTPQIVCDGLALVDAWRAGQWDLLITDIQMPVLDGVAAARRIRAEEHERGIAPTPILALTANAMAHHAEEYSAAGIDGLVAKPIAFADLVRAINETAGKRWRPPGGLAAGSMPGGLDTPEQQQDRRSILALD